MGYDEKRSDLLQVLPQLLPTAILWAEEQARRAIDAGQPLDADGLVLARRVGVRHPELVRVQIFDEIQLPEDPGLRQAALAAGFLGPGTTALTLGCSISILRGHVSRRLLSHELRHVHQYEEAGSIAAFLPMYLQQILVCGYNDAQLERDARDHEVDPVG